MSDKLETPESLINFASKREDFRQDAANPADVSRHQRARRDDDPAAAARRQGFECGHGQGVARAQRHRPGGFFDEAYIVDDRRGQAGLDMEKIRREGIRNHPERREIIMFSAENRRGDMLTAKHFILRPEVGKAKLSPLSIDPVFDHSEGRMVGLLNWAK